MKPVFLPRLLACAAALAVMVLAGCTAAEAAPAPATHTLEADSSSYLGYVVPQRNQQLKLTAKDLSVKSGQRVDRGDPLSMPTEQERASAEALRRHYSDRIAAADSAMEELRSSAVAIPQFRADPSVSSQEIRAVEAEIEAALIAAERVELQYHRDREAAEAQSTTVPVESSQESDSPESGSAESGSPAEQAADQVKYLADDHLLADRELTSQLMGLLTRLRESAQAERNRAGRALAAHQAPAPYAGTVTVRGDQVWLASVAQVFVFVATEAQADALSVRDDLTLQMDGATVGELQLSEATYAPEATTDPESPRYELRFAINAPASFAPREHSTATMNHSSAQVVVPEAFLGHDDTGHFVLSNGERVAVQVDVDDQGQHVITAGDVVAGDRVEEVGAG